MANFYLVQPDTDPEGVLTNASVVSAGALPQYISGLAPNSYRVASLAYAAGSYLVYSPSMLFASGEIGAWYEPSDLTTLFQDSAGTTPVTAPGQPVGLVLDKSGRGNHATQSTAGSRPIYGINPLGGVRNLLTYTEQFDNAIWTKNAGASLSYGVADPLGGTTAATFTAIGASASLQQAHTLTSVVSITGSIWIRRRTGSGVISIRVGDATTIPITVTSSWTRISETRTPSTTTARLAVIIADTGDAVDIWGAQLETGSTATAYQRVNSQYDITEAGVPSLSYLKFDGIDDFLVTGSINFTSTDKMALFAGVRKLSDTGYITELSTDASSTYGTFRAITATGGYGFQSRGSINAAFATIGAGFAAPNTSVFCGTGDIAGDMTTLRLNGMQVGQSTADQGTGNYGNYPLYIGRRGIATLPFNGNLYSLIVRGAATSAGDIANTETWVNSKTGAY